MSSLEKAIAEAFASMLVMPARDQYGNTIESPVQFALNEWAKKNSAEILEAVAKRLSVKDAADLVAEKIAVILKNSSSWNNVGRDKFLGQLEPMIMDKMAAILAAERLAELKKPAV